MTSQCQWRIDSDKKISIIMIMTSRRRKVFILFFDSFWHRCIECSVKNSDGGDGLHWWPATRRLYRRYHRHLTSVYLQSPHPASAQRQEELVSRSTATGDTWASNKSLFGIHYDASLCKSRRSIAWTKNLAHLFKISRNTLHLPSKELTSPN